MSSSLGSRSRVLVFANGPHLVSSPGGQEGPAGGVRVRGDPGGDPVRQGDRGERRVVEPRQDSGEQEEAEDHDRDRVLLAVVWE